MGIVDTDVWLEEDFDRPMAICKKLISQFPGHKPVEIYRQLQNFGMYKPSKICRDQFEAIRKNNLWHESDKIFKLYQSKWKGPDIPIYLFPINQRRNFLGRNDEKTKGGVSYPDRMFLFLSDKVDYRELEALFVHEYHHVCRLNKQKKPFKEYTLLDSLIIEGLAEYAVLVHCGRKYLANWCNLYTDQEYQEWWNKYLKNQLDLKKTEPKHDELLYGLGRFPKLLGYAAGFKLVSDFYKENHYSAKLSFGLPAEKYVINE
nr:DUF2268 domain-containing protein [Neobacillus sp. Marseille-Q6967]